MKVTGKGNRGAWMRWVLVGAAALLLVLLLVWGIRGLMGSTPGPAKKPPKITMLPDKPPPPPPPPKDKPEPPKPDQKEVKTETPKEPTPQAQNEPLKMEGAAGDGPSAFASGSVNKEYVGGTVGGRMQQGLYANKLQRYLQEVLNRNRKLRQTDYRVIVSVWLSADGAVQKVELGQSTGNVAVDDLLKDSLMQAAAMHEGPPDNMPQPIRIRVTARGA